MKTRFTQAAIDRQAALDYIIANPGASAPDIVAAMGVSRTVGAGRLIDMVGHGEIARTPTTIQIINKHGHKVTLHTYAYTALVTKARSEADTKKRMVANLGMEKEVIEAAPVIVERWVHRSGDHPIRNQGGQGNRRHEIRRGCSLS